MTTEVTPPVEHSRSPGLADCPYKGLQPYTEEDEAYYFGRDADRDLVIANLMASRLTVLYGPSGVGKSSLLQAGVARQLRCMTDGAFSYLAVGDSIVVYYAAWRDEPLVGLGEALRSAIPSGWLPSDYRLPAVPLSLEMLLNVTKALDADVYLLLDQFEEQELYVSARAAEQFAVELGRIVGAPGLRVSVLIGVREDSLAKLDMLEVHVPGILGNNLRLDHLHADAARQAIEKPLAQHNSTQPHRRPVSIEPRLVDELLRQLRTGHVSVIEAGQGHPDRESATIETPFLQLVMTRLWAQENSRASSLLHVSTLHDLGDAERIVRTHLDEVMNQLTDAQCDIAARVFRHLVTPSGMKIAHTADDLAEYAGAVDAGQLTAVLESLSSGRERILRPVEPPPDRPGTSRYEIFHDVLAPAVLDWRSRYVAEQERAASERDLIERRQAAERQNRDTKRRLHRSRLVSGGLVLLLVAASAAGVLAKSKNDEVHASAVLAEAQQRLDSDPAASLHLALQAFGELQSPAARTAVRVALDADLERLKVTAGKGFLNASSFTPDGKSFVTAGSDGVARLFDVATGRLTHELAAPGARSELTSARFSDDGSMLATTSTAPKAQVYDVRTGRLLLTVGGYQDYMWTTWATVDGEPVLLTGGYAKPWQAWRPHTSKLLATYGSAHSRSSWASFSKDSAQVVTVDGTVLKVWDVRTGRLLKRSSALGVDVGAVAFVGASSDRIAVWVRQKAKFWSLAFWDWAGSKTAKVTGDGSRLPSGITVSQDRSLVAVITDKRVIVYDAATGGQDMYLPSQPDLLTAVEFSRDNQWLITLGVAGHALIWRRGGADSAPVATLAGSVSGMHLSPADPDIVLTTSPDGTARLWQLPRRTIVAQSRTWIRQADISPDGKRVLSISDLGLLRVSNLATGREEGRQSITAEGGRTVFEHALWLIDGRQAVISSRWDPEPSVWDGTSDNGPRPLEANDARTNALAVSPEGDRVAMGDNKNRVVVWNLGSGAIEVKLTGGAASYRTTDVDFVPGSTLVAGASSDGTVRVWNVLNGGSLVRTLGAEGSSPLTAVDVSPDGSWLATAAANHELRIYRLADGALVRTIRGPTSYFADVTFSRDAAMLAVAVGDGAVYVWQRSTGDQLAVLHRHGDAVNTVEFTRDGKRLVTASDDGTAAIFACTTCADSPLVLRAAQDRDEARSRRAAVPFEK